MGDRFGGGVSAGQTMDGPGFPLLGLKPETVLLSWLAGWYTFGHGKTRQVHTETETEAILTPGPHRQGKPHREGPDIDAVQQVRH